MVKLTLLLTHVVVGEPWQVKAGEFVGWVGVLGHALSMIDIEGVLAKGGIGVLVLEGLGLLLVPAVFLFR